MMRLILLLTCISFAANSQNVEFGISTGPNYTINGKIGYDAMLVLSTDIEDNMHFQLEVGYSQTESYNEYEFLRMAFITKYSFWKGFNFQGGPRFGSLLKGTHNGNEIKDTHDFAQISIVGGVGYRIGKLDLSTRYNHCINRNDKSFQLSIGLFFL